MAGPGGHNATPRPLMRGTLESNLHKWQSVPVTNLDNLLTFVKVAEFESLSVPVNLSLEP
jgi:hypothetical protein